MTEFAQALAQGKGEARGLIMLDVVQRRVGARQTQQLVEEEMEVGRQTREKRGFGGHLAEAQIEFLVARRLVG